MKPKTLILMVVAVVCGLGASYMTSRLLAEREPQTVAVQAPVEKVKLLVAKTALNAHTYIKNPQDLFVEKEFVKENVSREAVTDPLALKGKTLKHSLRREDHVMPEDLADGSPVLEVPPGHQAMGLSVTVHTTAGGFASLPGSRVDIVWTKRGNSDVTSFSKTLLQNVLVLAADGAKNRPDDAGPIPASVVTLALSPEDVRRVANATESGTMRLVLRIPGDNSVVKNDTTTLEQTIKGDQKLSEVVGAPAFEEEPLARVQPLAKVQPPPDAQGLPQVETPPEVKTRTHVVWFRQGDKQWKEVFILDERGNVVNDDDVGRVEAQRPATPPQQPAADTAPRKVPPKDR